MLQQALLIGIMTMWDDTMMQQWMELKGELLIYNIFSPTLYICAYNFFFFWYHGFSWVNRRDVHVMFGKDFINYQKYKQKT